MSSIDVVVPCYRYGRFLRACIESILAQAVPNLRVLIIDDASPDDTAEVATALSQEDRRVEFLRHGRNLGHIATYNEGIEWASADYMLVLSADDLLMPGAFKRSMDLMDHNPAVGMTYGGVIYVSGTFLLSDLLWEKLRLRRSPFQEHAAIAEPATAGAAGPSRMALASGELPRIRCPSAVMPAEILDGADFIASNRHNNQVHPATAIVRRKLQQDLGGYRKELPHAGDLEMWLRFAARAPVGLIHAYQAAARVHGANMSSSYHAHDMLYDFRQRKDVLDILFGASDRGPEPRLRAVMQRGLAEAAVRAAGVPLRRGDQNEIDQFLQLAGSVYPRIRRTPLWYGFKLKRQIGPGAWSLCQPVARRLAARLSSIGRWDTTERMRRWPAPR